MTTTRTPLRYAVIGAGNRCQMFVDAICGPHADVAELVAVGDTNPGRTDYYLDRAEQLGAQRPVALDLALLGEEIAAREVDRVVLTTPDHTHAELIVRTLHAGADVVVEKPLTVDVEGSRRIARAMRETGRDVVVTFNYRYSPRNTAVRTLIRQGAVGRVVSVDFQWMLDTVHGADYFRRWHRVKENSGGLLVHKASHHFDLVNWWLDDRPEKVYASGGLRFYGAQAAASRGLTDVAERGTSTKAAGDPFALDLRSDDRLRQLYLEQEHVDGYRRDQGVFTDGITIEDNMAVVVDYADGATLSYSLNAHCPWEGYRVAVNGTEGRVELDVVERAAVLPASGGSPVDPSVVEDDQGALVRRRGERLLVQRHWEAAQEVPVVNARGSHGGGDRLLLADIFVGPVDDGLGRPAGYLDGVRAIGVGIAGNRSMETGGPVRLDDLDLLGEGAA